MHALIYMQPLDAHRQPCAPVKHVATVERGEQPHRVGTTWQVSHLKEMPYYVHTWADNEPQRGCIREIDCAGPSKLRHLKSVCFHQLLTVLPRARQ